MLEQTECYIDELMGSYHQVTGISNVTVTTV